MSWLVDPTTRKQLPALDTERRFLSRLRDRQMCPRFVPVYEGGIPVRMVWVDPGDTAREESSEPLREGDIRATTL